MPGIVWKSVHGKKYMVLRWKKCTDGQFGVAKEIYIGNEERLAQMPQDLAEETEIAFMGSSHRPSWYWEP